MLKLRPYQADFLGALRSAFAGGAHRVLGVAPTGSGKTQCATAMTFGAAARGSRVLFAAGRRELIAQTARTFARNAGAILDDDAPVERAVEASAAVRVPLRVIRASEDLGPADASIIIGSVQTLTQPRWLGRLPEFHLGILDEAHHGAAATWADLVRSQAGARWVGLTATPERAGGEPLDLFDALVPGSSVAELTALGHLVPCRIWAGPATLKPGELAMTPLEAYQRFAAGQRCAVFCRNRAHARAELANFLAAGIPSAVILGDSRDREATLNAWRAGQILVALSVNVLTEGFDLPELGAAILARRFNHAGGYLQAGGRIIRAAPGKTGAILIDLTGCAHEHGPLDLERTYSLTGKAIRGAVVKDAVRHCTSCGSISLAGPPACPYCGARFPVRPLAAPRSVGAGVAELPVAAPRREYVVSMISKRVGTCARCGRGIRSGEPIFWATLAKQARHQQCPATAQIGHSP